MPVKDDLNDSTPKKDKDKPGAPGTPRKGSAVPNTKNDRNNDT